jgi:nucleoside-diphosphate-sugar epimerase
MIPGEKERIAMRIFVAGATGVIGRRVVPALVGAGPSPGTEVTGRLT